jgi:hypothetical protein
MRRIAELGSLDETEVMLQHTIILLGYFAAVIFFAVRLFGAMRCGKIWFGGVWPPIIEKHSSPWNYWIAVLIQAVFMVGFAVALVSQVRKL